MAQTYFKLSVVNEEEELPGTAYISANYAVLNRTPIKTYTGNDEDIIQLRKLTEAIFSDNKSLYKELSVANDTTVDNSYEFYHAFLPHSESPAVYAKSTVGTISFLYVFLDESAPLTVFVLEHVNDTIRNHPQLSEDPIVTVLTDAVNKTYLLPNQFQPEIKTPTQHTILQFDSLADNPDLALAINLDLKKVQFDVNDRKDSSNKYDAQYKPVLEFYRGMLDDLAQPNLTKYYLRLSDGSKDRVSKSMNQKNNNPAESRKFYSEYKRTFTKVTHIVDMGQVKILFAANPDAPEGNPVQKIYLLEQETGITFINEFLEFYLDDLFRTKTFKNALYN